MSVLIQSRHPLGTADGFGIRPVLREMARELAGHGYYVLVPNSFHRHGPAPLVELPEYIGEEVRPAVFAQLMPLIEAHTVERVLSDADAYLRFLTTQPEAGAGPVAVTGYCIGGLYAMRTAAAHPDHVPEALGELNQALDAASVDHTSEIYPGTLHGFTMSDIDAFSASGLKRHWDRLLPLLDRTLANS
ncbi:dienelactone hydrolase family protein [Streptomyces sp. NPDC014623]|uniref:dienelactone hydrolase family protein n=1 Tax=Streptomyces sp. NPDC014623 TaxID=3364875 RepID=UPI0036F8F7AD